ncbi:16935_t:CDS:1, partial [Rhizophagus irregularis]
NIMVIESDMSDELQDGNSTEKLEHLERDRHLILRKLEGKDKVLIDIPYFFMYLYADVLGIFTENLNKAFLPDSDWSWNNWEIFIADFIASHITMIDVLKKEKLLKLGDFFRSAQGSDITLGLLINFESVEIYELIHQFPCLNLSAKAGKTAMLKPGYIMIN